MTRSPNRTDKPTNPGVKVTAGQDALCLSLGTVLADTFEIRELLSAGALGQTYGAYDRVLGRDVAIKVALPGVGSEVLRREARTLAGLRHPGLREVFGYGTHGESEYIVMERVYASSLADHIELRRERGAFSPPEAVEILVGIADSLAVLHRAGVVHQLLRAESVMIARGRILLDDVGAAQPDAFVTVPSPRYRAPELVAGGLASDPRVDLYSLGVLGLELLLTGHVPEDHAGIAASLSSSAIPDALKSVLGELVAPDPLVRPRDATVVAAALRGALVSEHHKTRPLTIVIADDDPDARKLLETIVRGIAPDAQVYAAVDGGQALSFTLAYHPDILFLDLDMPVHNGVEVCMYLRGTTSTQDIAICVHSNHASKHRDVLTRLGAIEIVDKERLSPARLTEAIASLVRRLRPRHIHELVEPDGHVIGERYILGQRLGGGGMGSVYEARHVELGKVFALKMMHPSIAAEPGAQARFQEEARIASQISHPNIVSVVDFGIDRSAGAFMVMEFARGNLLSNERRAGMSLRRACESIAQVADALSHLHRHSIVHGDIKAENVIITEEQSEDRRRHVARLLDFGLSRRLTTLLVEEQVLAGTPDYMAPECAQGAPFSVASDIYALGVLAYYLLSGRMPFEATTPQQLLHHHVGTPAPPMSSSASTEPVDPALDTLVLRALSKDPADRHASMEAFKYELNTAMNMLAIGRRRVREVRSTDSGLLKLLAESHIGQALIDRNARVLYSNPAFKVICDDRATDTLTGFSDALGKLGAAGCVQWRGSVGGNDVVAWLATGPDDMLHLLIASAGS